MCIITILVARGFKLSQATRAGQVTSIPSRSPRRPSRPLEDSGVDEKRSGEHLLVIHLMGFHQGKWGFNMIFTMANGDLI